MDVTLCTTRIVRVRLGGEAPGVASYLPPHAWSDVPHEMREGPPKTIGTDSLSVSVSDDSIAFADRQGNVSLQLALDQTRVQPRLLVRLQTIGEQHFYGLGEGGPQFDRLGAVRRFWNFQVNRGQGADMAVPLLLSTAGYGVFFDSAAAATLEPGDAPDGAWLEYRSDPGSDTAPLDLYVIRGDGLRQVLGDVATLLGPATMPPRWALGYMQSSRHFAEAAEVRDLAATFRSKRLPCDALIFLSSYGTAKGWNRGVGHLDFEPDVFKNADAMLAAFRDQHFHVITHEYPVLHEASGLYDEADANGYLLDVAYPRLTPAHPGAVVYKEGQRLIDFSQPAARAWWWQSHKHLRDRGVAGWWLDGGEGPAASASLREGPARVLHNRYDLLRQQAFADGEATDRPDTRPYLLCRSGGPGMQRFGAAPWSGDINATFASLELQIRTGLNVGMSGVPHWGTDTGGFYRVGVNDAELFVRWFQFSAFCSIFRGHGFVWREHLPWSHGETSETICRDYLELRSRLMPYTYTLAWQARRQGLPMMRPLVLNYPDDPATWDLGTQYLWGDDILVAPVTRKGATQWTVYLPAGIWHDYWTQEAYQGPAGVTVAAPLDRLPLLVRSGAILPQGPVMQHDGERPLDEVTLLVYPGGASSFSLYEDDGLTNAYRDGVYVETRFTSTADEAGVTFRVEPSQGNRSLIPGGRRYTLELRTSRAPRRVTIDGAGAPGREHASESEWRHDGVFLSVRLPPTPCSAQIIW
ncbi:MAG: glycoside hydrolase family 31 protein [Proteobacteria bacterium]|nr:glycoside hydrolase family 31 protein [Pseudomonadota bacterium]